MFWNAVKYCKIKTTWDFSVVSLRVSSNLVNHLVNNTIIFSYREPSLMQVYKISLEKLYCKSVADLSFRGSVPAISNSSSFS